MQFLRLCTGTLIAALLPHAAFSANILTNGDFETGTSTGWTMDVLAGSNGTQWYFESDTSSPIDATTPGPASGTYYAITSQGGPGTIAMRQSFNVAPGAGSVILSFQMFVDDLIENPNVNPAGLDHTATKNQHARVDLLASGAGAFDTSAAAVLRNFYLGTDPGGPPRPWISYEFDITSEVAAGGTFQLRFAEVDNLGNFHLGVDSVSVDVQAIPEPGSLALVAGGFLLAFGLHRRRSS